VRIEDSGALVEPRETHGFAGACRALRRIEFTIPIATPNAHAGANNRIDLARHRIVAARLGEPLAGPQLIADEVVAAVQNGNVAIAACGTIDVAKQPLNFFLVDLVAEPFQRARDVLDVDPSLADKLLGLAVDCVDQVFCIEG
jgi:hypothetical protein